MKRHRIDRFVLGLTYLCTTLLGETAQARTKMSPSHDASPSRCSPVDDRAREVTGRCTLADRHTSLASQPLPLQKAADNELLLLGDRTPASDHTDHNGHFDAAGRTGLIPVGRVGWREISTWREMHRLRGKRQVP